MKFLSFLICIFFVLQAYSVERSSKITCMTSSCHGDLKKSAFLHSPIKAKGCIVCHALVPEDQKDKKLSAKHPSIALKMGKDEVTICLKCHQEWSGVYQAKQYSHGAIEKKGCVSCHNPHGADNKQLLKIKEFNKDLCVSCHKKDDNWEKGDKDTTHKALVQKSKCLNCHEVHSSKTAKLLKMDSVALCAKCHEEIGVVKEKGSIHTPVKEKKCLKCHSVHYSSKEGLLEKTYEGESYVKSTEKSFQLCLDCHNIARTTQFRNGTKNMHTLHVQAKTNDKEHGCASCHEVHQADQAMLIRKSFTFKKVIIPIAFTQTENGGNCTTACHGKKDYDRVTPAVNKEGR